MPLRPNAGPSPLPAPSIPLARKVSRASGAGAGTGAQGGDTVGGEPYNVALDSGKRSVFSFNLVEKLLSLGLHRVAARGMVTDSEAAEKRGWPWAASLRSFVP